MIVLQKYLKQSATYKLFLHLLVVLASFLETLGQIAQLGFHTLKCVLKGEIDVKELLTQKVNELEGSYRLVCKVEKETL